MAGGSAQKTVVSVGDLVADIVVAIRQFPVQAGQHQLTRDIRLEPGGAGNFLVAGARLGMRMIALGALGGDPFGASAAEALAEEGVELDRLIRQPGTNTTTVIVLLDEAGRHVFLGGYGVGPAIALPAGWRAAISEADALFASGYTLHEQRLAEAALQMMALAHSAGRPVFFDPGPEMAEATAEQRCAALAASSAILMTEEEIPLMTGGPGGLDAARALLKEGPQLVCIKRGSRGCLILSPAGEAEHAGYAVAVRDTTAAGDSFDAAFIFARLRGMSLDDTAAFANAMGAAKVQKVGSGRQVPTADEVRAVLQQHGAKIEF